MGWGSAGATSDRWSDMRGGEEAYGSVGGLHELRTKTLRNGLELGLYVGRERTAWVVMSLLRLRSREKVRIPDCRIGRLPKQKKADWPKYLASKRSERKARDHS